MTVEVLKSKSEIDSARIELRRRGLSFIGPWWLRKLREHHVVRGVNIGHHVKSWDILKTATFIEKNISKNGPILDIGAYASEILYVLHRLDYSELTGVDLNPKIELMPHRDNIRYKVADFMHTELQNEAFEAITAISVIEHGFKSQPLLKGIYSLLRPGGYFIASFDYWPDKIDTAGIDMFGLDWRIFSKTELLAFMDEAREYGLVPYGPMDLEVEDPVMNWAGRSYTFAWLVLSKAVPSGRASS